jgi:uncharacterized membrane protein YeiH
VTGFEAMRNAGLLLATDVVGVFIGALNGALVACRRPKFDLVGIVSVAVVSGLGGGLTRDVLLEQGAPLALRFDAYLFAALAGGIIGFFSGLRISASPFAPHVDTAIKYTDALTLGNFAVTSTLLALNAKLTATACLIIGVIGATGGGVMRDVLIGEPIALFIHGELYATAAGAASATTLAGILLLNQNPVLSAAMGWIVGITLRLMALVFKWKGPLPPGAPRAPPAVPPAGN